MKQLHSTEMYSNYIGGEGSCNTNETRSIYLVTNLISPPLDSGLQESIIVDEM